MPRTVRLALLTAFALVSLASRPAAAAVRLDPLQNDSGRYQVYFRDRLLGTETFAFRPTRDSVVITSEVAQNLPGPDGDEALEKNVSMVLKAIDYGLLGYVSTQKFLGKELLRAITVYDTTFTAYREVYPEGNAETFARPPGRLFVIDSQVFALFDVMLRSLHGKLSGERPMAVVVLGERDTTLEIMIRPGADETIQLGGAPRSARRVTLSDGMSEFVIWISPRGSMLRLTQPATGLRVDRDLPAPKRSTGAAPARAGPSKPAPPAKPGHPAEPGPSGR